MLGCDLIAIPLAFLLGIYLRSGELSFDYFKHPLLFLIFAVFLGAFYVFDFYYPFKHYRFSKTAIETAYATLLGGVFLFSISYLDRTFSIPRPILILTISFIALFVYGIRIFYDFIFRYRLLIKRAAIIGVGEFAKEIDHVIRQTPHSGIHVVGFVREDENVEREEGGKEKILGSLSQLLSLIQWSNIDLVILALDEQQKKSESDVMQALFNQDIQVVSAVHLFEKLDEAIPYKIFNEHYFLDLVSEVREHYYLKAKRLVDIFFSFFLLILSLPIIGLTMMALGTTLGVRHVFFIQERIGKDRKPFNIIKFRTMTKKSDGRRRITAFGRCMRRYRIDEIPQLINVIKGEMSLIGPRPEIVYYVDKCRERIPFYEVVFALRPGITGWAQTKFHHVTALESYSRKFEYNLYYLKNISLTLDLLILIKTVRTVLLGKGK